MYGLCVVAVQECAHLKDSVAVERGFCDGETKRLEFMFYPTDITIVSNKTAFNNENYVISCEQLLDKTVRCSSDNDGTYRYNETTNILDYNFTFNRIRHDGKFLRIKTNTNCSTEDVQFYPLKQRTSPSQCKNDNCNVSTAEIHIAGQNATCVNSTRFFTNRFNFATDLMPFEEINQRLPNGLICDMEYVYNSYETIRCVLDGVTYNITNTTFEQENTNGQGRCNRDSQQLTFLLLMFSIAII